MKYVFALGLIAVIAAVAVAVVNGARSRSAKSDWLDELDEIRLSSLGDDQEVTGALHAVPAEVALAPDFDHGDEHPSDRDGEPGQNEVELEPTKVVVEAEESIQEESASPLRREAANVQPIERDDAGMLFHEYAWDETCLLRVDATNPEGLRVVANADDSGGVCTVDLPRGSLWHRGPNDAKFSVQTTDGLIQGFGTCAVAVDENWTFAICLEGEMSLRHLGTDEVDLAAGCIGRMGHDDAQVQVMNAGFDALEDQDIVKRHRRLDTK